MLLIEGCVLSQASNPIIETFAATINPVVQQDPGSELDPSSRPWFSRPQGGSKCASAPPLP